MEFGPLGEEVYKRTYSRTKADGSKESWPETVDRVVAGNVELAGFAGITEEDEDLRERIADFRVIPAGRHLWASGSGTGLGLFNCHRSGWGPGLADHFLFTFEQLMLGGGVGANYSTEYLEALPVVSRDVEVLFSIDHSHADAALFAGVASLASAGDAHIEATLHAVADSREGWVEALQLVFAVAEGAVFSPSRIVFDVSDVRAAGSPIRGFGGTASGPLPLAEMLVGVAAELNDCDGLLTPLGAMAIDHAIASCVVAGNVRRSARMSILPWWSHQVFDFINCKADTGSHWTTNISVEVDARFWRELEAGGGHAEKVLAAVSAGMLRDGEPGFFNSGLASEGETGDVRSTNPCGEIALEPWEQCCLGHVNLAHPAHVNQAELFASFRAMARFLVRATLAPSSDERQEDVKNRNRRIGVGFFGFQEWLAARGLKYSEAYADVAVQNDLRYWRAMVKLAADAEADRLGVERPVKYTTVAPTGTIAKLPGVTEGMHPVYAKHFLRRVRYAEDSPELARLRAAGYPVEPCIYSARTEVVSFFVEDTAALRFGDLIESVDEIGLDILLSTQAMVQERFADNAVSFTANVAAGRYSVRELSDLIRVVGPRLKGTTVFPDLSRPQSPMERLTRGEYLAGGILESGQSIDDECATGACPVR